MRRVVLVAIALLAASGADAAAPRARIATRIPLPALSEAAITNDGTTTWVVFRPDNSPAFAARVGDKRLYPGPQLNRVFSPIQLIASSADGLWFGDRSGALELSPRTGKVTRLLRLGPNGAPPWDGAAYLRARHVIWWGTLAIDTDAHRLLGALDSHVLVAPPLRVGDSVWLAAYDAVRRFDARTGRLLGLVRWKGHVPTAGPVAFGGHLWVAFQQPALAASEVDLRALDPRTGTLGETLVLPAIPGSENDAVMMRPVHLHAAADALWVIRPQVSSDYARLYRLDPRTGTVTPEVAVPYTNLTRIPWRGREFWTTDGRVVFGVRVS